MLTYLVRRIIFGAAVLLGTSIITFVIAFVVPADPAVAMAGAKADPQTLAMIRHELGLDQPLYVQYARYLDRALHGDLGRSYIRRENVTTPDRRAASRRPPFSPCPRWRCRSILGIAMGMVAAAYRGSRLDNILLVISLGAGFDSGVLARHDAADRRRPLSALVSARRLRRPEKPGAADDDARARLGRLLLAHPAHQSRRRDGPGLHPHRARQGALAARA